MGIRGFRNCFHSISIFRRDILNFKTSAQRVLIESAFPFGRQTFLCGIRSWHQVPSLGEKNMLALEITSYRSVSSQTSCDGNRNILKTFTGIRRVMFYWFATTKWTLPVSSFLPRENTIFRGKKSETRKRLSYICSRLKSQKTLSVDNCLWGQALSSFSISKSLIITCDLHRLFNCPLQKPSSIVAVSLNDFL